MMEISINQQVYAILATIELALIHRLSETIFFVTESKYLLT